MFCLVYGNNTIDNDTGREAYRVFGPYADSSATNRDRTRVLSELRACYPRRNINNSDVRTVRMTEPGFERGGWTPEDETPTIVGIERELGHTDGAL